MGLIQLQWRYPNKEVSQHRLTCQHCWRTEQTEFHRVQSRVFQFYITGAIFRKDAVSTYPQGEAALVRHGKRLQALVLLLWLVLKTQLFWSPAVIIHQVKFLGPLLTCLSALKQTSINKAPGKATRCQTVSKKWQFNKILTAAPYFSPWERAPNKHPKQNKVLIDIVYKRAPAHLGQVSVIQLQTAWLMILLLIDAQIPPPSPTSACSAASNIPPAFLPSPEHSPRAKGEYRQSLRGTGREEEEGLWPLGIHSSILNTFIST